MLLRRKLGALVCAASLSVAATAQIAFESLRVLPGRVEHQMVGGDQKVWMTGGHQGSAANDFPDVWEYANGTGAGSVQPAIHHC
jgi:hypothetical protein